MVKLDEFDIQFDNAEHAYFAGQEVSGRIIIKNTKTKKVDEILFEIKGYAKTYWTKHSGRSRRHYSASDDYFYEQFNTKYMHQFHVATTQSPFSTAPSTSDGGPSVNNNEKRVLPVGTHEIPFSYTLPKSLPSSFEGDYGYVRYTCRAICERPWDFDISTRRAFTVVGVEDLNEDAEALRPTSDSATVKQKLWCFNRGEVTVEIQLPRSGYAPGETIHANVHVQNKSKRTIRFVNINLCQNVTYKAKTFAGAEQIRQTSKIVAKIERNSELCASSESWDDVELVVPSVTPRLSTCNIIDISYVLQIDMQSNTALSVPILIGTIPLLSEILKRSTNTAQSVEKNYLPIETSVAPDDSSIVQVTITDESGYTAKVKDDLIASPPQTTSAIDKSDKVNMTTPITLDEHEDSEIMNEKVAKKRVRVPSSILSELYPTLPSPYYKESYFGRVIISDEKERNQFGDNYFVPKYPFYADD